MPWTDDFERADGPLGANWTDTNADWQIASGNAYRYKGTGVALVASLDSAGAHQATIETTHPGGYGQSAYVLVKWNPANATGYVAYFETSPSAGFLYLRPVAGGLGSPLGTYNCGPLSGVHTIGLSYDGGSLAVTLDGTERITASNSTYDTNTRLGIYSATATDPILSFSTAAVVSQSLDIDPNAVWIADLFANMTATLTGGTWSDEYPYDVTLSVDHGVVLTMAVMDSTTIDWQYYCVGYVGTVTVTESKYGLTGTFEVTTTQPPGYQPDVPLSDKAAGILNRTGDACPSGTILSTCTPVYVSPDINIPKSLEMILWILGGATGQLPPDVSLHSSIADILLALNNGATYVPNDAITDRIAAVLSLLQLVDGQVTLLRGGGYGSLKALADALGGSPTLYSHADLKALLDGIRGADLASILAAIAAVRGAGSPDLAAVLTAIANVRGAGSPDLAAVLLAIDALGTPAQTSDADALAVQIADFRLYVETTLTTIQSIASSTALAVSALADSLAAYRTANDYTVQTILDAIAGIGGGPGTGGPSLSLWPGLAGVTLGTEVGLVDDLLIAGPLHGLLFTITGQPEHNQKYMFGEVASWARVGQVIFRTDRGDYERSQTFGIDRQIMTPLTMESADAALIRLNPNWTGTVRPWTRT